MIPLFDMKNKMIPLTNGVTHVTLSDQRKLRLTSQRMHPLDGNALNGSRIAVMNAAIDLTKKYGLGTWIKSKVFNEAVARRMPKYAEAYKKWDLTGKIEDKPIHSSVLRPMKEVVETHHFPLINCQDPSHGNKSMYRLAVSPEEWYDFLENKIARKTRYYTYTDKHHTNNGYKEYISDPAMYHFMLPVWSQLQQLEESS